MHHGLQQSPEIDAGPKWQQPSPEKDADPKRQARSPKGKIQILVHQNKKTKQNKNQQQQECVW